MAAAPRTNTTVDSAQSRLGRSAAKNGVPRQRASSAAPQAPPYRLTIFDIFGQASAGAVDINEAGHIVFNDFHSNDFNGLDQRVYFWDGMALVALGQGEAAALNNRDQIVGSAFWDTATSTRIPAPDNARVFDINDNGQIVGYRNTDPNGIYHAALGQDAAFEQRVDLGQGLEFAVNNQGQVVGWDPYQPLTTAALWERGSVTLLAGQSAVSWANNINDAAQIAGLFPGIGRSFIWDGDSQITLLDMLGDYTRVNDINLSGRAVGWFIGDGGTRRGAALWNGTAATDLNTLLRPESAQAGWVLESASAINDAGAVVGAAYNRSACTEFACERYGFVLALSDLPDQVLQLSPTAPIPEPST